MQGSVVSCGSHRGNLHLRPVPEYFVWKMNLPEELQQAIDAEIAPFPQSALARASAELTRRYKSPGQSKGIKDETLRAAYLAVRLPATFAAVSRVLAEIRRLNPHTEISSLLDLGSGPGTALWAAAEAFPDIATATLMDSDSAWIRIGQRIAAQSSRRVIRQAEWVPRDLSSVPNLSSHDLVLISYVLGELESPSREAVFGRALQSARKYLVIVEPGTVRGFEIIHGLRSALIAAGIGILAPCPHRETCPLFAAGDWCHFSERVERTASHRQIKRGELGYEDEKFSYIVVDKQRAAATGGGRVVRHPMKRSGHVQLKLCTARGIEQVTVGKSQKAEYKLARHTEWGDVWEME